jgi:hypothetical protein
MLASVGIQASGRGRMLEKVFHEHGIMAAGLQECRTQSDQQTTGVHYTMYVAGATQVYTDASYGCPPLCSILCSHAGLTRLACSR